MKAFLKNLFSQKGEVNYLYFSCFLFFLGLLIASHYKEHPLSGFPLFFLLYAMGQAFLEVSIFVLIAYVLKKWAPRWLFFLFIGVFSLLLFFHLVNSVMVRLMDASISYIFKFFFGSGIDHVIAGFQALNMNATMIAIIVATFLAIPAAGLGFYALTHYLVRRKPLTLSLNQIALTIGAIGAVLFLLDLFARPFLTSPVYSKYKKTLPFGSTFLSPTPQEVFLPNPLASFRDEAATAQQLPSITLTHRPNIYLFVIETLRHDFLDAAEHLQAFGKEYIQIPHSFANANATHLSWFAIFHADIPFYWAQMRDVWQKGSIPLQILKKLGYQIHVYSSADLRYFNMDKLLFGHSRELVDQMEEYSFQKTMEPCERDLLALASLQRDLTKKEGQVYLIFLDSPHSEYSFPKNFPLKYTPIAKEIDYLTIGPKSPELELVKNRYRNAIHYIDHLMGQFFQTLKEKNLFDDAIIAITGDHGEEFFEEGALFHGTHLNHYQTSVPMLFKFPSKEWIPQTEEATHIDLFPSILHYLTGQSDFTSLFDGRSIFHPDRPPYRIAVLQNGPETPIEFVIEKKDLKLRARFADPPKLEILELQGLFDPQILAPLLQR